MRKATNVRVIVSGAEVAYLQSGQTPVPIGTGTLVRAMVLLAKMLGSTSRDHYQLVTEGIIEIDQSGSLTEFGIDAWVYSLGAHTTGSIGLK